MDPKKTVAPVMKPVPVTVTLYPPETGPAAGDIPVTVGAAADAGASRKTIKRTKITGGR
jgi:hypothetical protein